MGLNNILMLFELTKRLKGMCTFQSMEAIYSIRRFSYKIHPKLLASEMFAMEWNLLTRYSIKLSRMRVEGKNDLIKPVARTVTKKRQIHF